MDGMLYWEFYPAELREEQHKECDKYWSERGYCIDNKPVGLVENYIDEEQPNLRTGLKCGWDGLEKELQPVTEMPLSCLDQLSVVGTHPQSQKLAGLMENKQGSFEAVEKQIEQLESIIIHATQALSTLKMEVGWLKKMSTMKW